MKIHNSLFRLYSYSVGVVMINSCRCQQNFMRKSLKMSFIWPSYCDMKYACVRQTCASQASDEEHCKIEVWFKTLEYQSNLFFNKAKKDFKSRDEYRKSSIRSRSCIILDPNSHRLVLEVFKKVSILQQTFFRVIKGLLRNLKMP